MNLFFIFYENITLFLSFQAFLFFICVFKYINYTKLQSISSEIQNPINTKPLITIKYEDKYKNDYLNLQQINLDKLQKDNLKNNFIMEHTPLGNVIMYYNNDKNGFVYYTDNTIPYRFLETVGRKYVTVFKCKDSSIYVDETDELESIKEENKEESKEESKECVVEENNKEDKVKDNKLKMPKNVFAKFKNYNHPNSIPSTAIVAKNNPNPIKNTSHPSKEIIEKKNKYICEGKIVNFSFLKKVDKKLVIKRLNMTFAEFKKMQVNGM